MAEKPEDTPENIQEEVETAASEEGAGATVPEGAEPEAAEAPEAAAEEAPAEEPKAKPASKAGPTRREKLEARRAERRAAASRRGPRTPEERQAEREERRKRNATQRRAYRAKQKEKRAELRKSQPPPEPDQAPEHGPGRAKVRQGIVVSDKADKTITVRIDVTRRHRRYHKIMRTSSTLHAHDEANDAHEGDTVRVLETRPMSRSKRWRLIEVVERAK